MILYLCALENTMNNNIHKNQIVPITRDEKIIVLFIAPMFIVNKSGVDINRQKYSEKNIFHIRIPFLSYNFLLNILLLPILLLLAMPIIIYFIYRYDIKVIHARNHISSYLAVLTKVFFDIKVISDFRGHYAEEGAIVGRWKYNSLSFKVWKMVEKYICKKSNIITTISKRMKNYYENIYDVDNIIYAPAVVDTEKFYFSEALRTDFRKEFEIKENEVVFIYVGSLGLWHDLESFYEILEEVVEKQSIKEYKVFILSKINANQNKALHEKHNTQILTVQPSGVNKFLCGSDIGILPGTKNNNEVYDILYKTMISSKVEEYLCTGLNIMVNERIEEVVELVHLKYSEIDTLIIKNKMRKNIADYYKSCFSSDIIKDKYSKIYGELND